MKDIYVKDFEPRLKAPLESPYYTKEPWGFNKALEINTKTHSVMPNCTGYAHGRWLEIGKFEKGDEYPKLCLGDAHHYYGYPDGYERSKTPRVGDIACFKGGTYGHIGVVEEVDADGTITVSMSQYQGNPVFYLRELKKPYSYTGGAGKMTFQGFIRCPYVKDNPVMDDETLDKLANEVIAGKWGNGATRVQRLEAAGYDYQQVQARVNDILHGQRFKVGDAVKIVNKGNSQANGGGHNAYGYGWNRKILAIHKNAKFPYQVGNDSGTTGFYTKEALKKI